MKTFRKVQTRLLGIKTIGYRIISFIFQTLILTLIMPFELSVLTVSVILTLQKTIVYFMYDYHFAQKYKMSKDKGFVLWATGIPCSGKSTLLDAVARELRKYDRSIERLDGDIVRTCLCKDLGFSAKDRKTNLQRITFVSKLLARTGTGVLCSFVSPFRNDRAEIRENVPNFIELYVYADKTVCAKRDVKGMWKKAKEGKIKGFTGHDAPYEAPYNPEILCNTAQETLPESVEIVMNYLRKRKLI